MDLDLGLPVSFGCCKQGQRVHVVANLLCWDPAHDTHVSHFWKVQQFPMPVLSVDDDTRVFMHETPSWQSLHEIELCAGFGGMTQGMLTSGFHAVAAVDQN